MGSASTMSAVSLPSMARPTVVDALPPQLVEAESVAVERERAVEVRHRQVDELESHAADHNRDYD